MPGSNAGGTYSPKQYWTRVADTHSIDESGFAPVLHPDAPAWFNSGIDKIQFRAIRRALNTARIPQGARVLDVGCGTGRWVRRYRALGFQVTGLDATDGMIRIAKNRDSGASMLVGEAGALPFAGGHFDLISDVTVIQHLPVPSQEAALAEMMRILKPGGCLLMLELIRGKGAHIFPRKPHGWIDLGRSLGATLIDWFGQEYLLVDRVFARTAQAIGGRANQLPAAGATREINRTSLSRRIFWSSRRPVFSVSTAMEPIVERLVPNQIATHAVFVFRKAL